MTRDGMEFEIEELRGRIVEAVLAKQDETFRWGVDARVRRQYPQYADYAPAYRSTLWTLVLLADIQAPPDLPQVRPSLELVMERFYDPQYGIFRLAGMSHFPIPCLNGNMIYLQHYFGMVDAEKLERTVAFFAEYQRFDEGDFKTPRAYPYNGNTSCYGKHTCYWGVTKLLKGISFIPRSQRSAAAQKLIERCTGFVLEHEVCFGSRHKDRLLHRDIGVLTFPNFYKSDFLEILWLLKREGVEDRRMQRAVELLRSRMKEGGTWEMEKTLNSIVPTGQKGTPNPFITHRARQVLA
jgi:hypothetical protein